VVWTAGRLERYADALATSLPDSTADEMVAWIAASQCVLIENLFNEYPCLTGRGSSAA
jgi:hypothetical protein